MNQNQKISEEGPDGCDPGGPGSQFTLFSTYAGTYGEHGLSERKRPSRGALNIWGGGYSNLLVTFKVL